MNSKSLLEALTRRVPPFNACFEVGFAAARDEADAVVAKIAAKSINAPRAAKTPDTSAFLGIWLLSDVFVAGGRESAPAPPERFSSCERTSVRPTGVMASERS